ncbi:unnamed protein product [Rotaria sp. Silwood2]|nr:unnamed protein product [Rotaria sp. Silwood2]
MFSQCETKYNCIASSTRRNELIIYNSKLSILIILQHEENKNFCHRLYLQWPSTLSSNLSDITYCHTNDHYLISTNDNNHLYIFNRTVLSIYDLGCLSDNLPLNHIHCYHRAVYCVLGNHNLVEYHLDELNSKLTNKRNIDLFNSNDVLLDITCDKNNLVVIYKNQNNEIYLRSINRKTLAIELEFLLDNKQETEGNSVRIESAQYTGNFIYVNSLQKYIKTIDLICTKNRKITATMQRNKTPTNICLLKDGRFWPINEPTPSRTTITFGVIFSDQYDLSVLKGPENGSKESLVPYNDWNKHDLKQKVANFITSKAATIDPTCKLLLFKILEEKILDCLSNGQKVDNNQTDSLSITPLSTNYESLSKSSILTDNKSLSSHIVPSSTDTISTLKSSSISAFPYETSASDVNHTLPKLASKNGKNYSIFFL